MYNLQNNRHNSEKINMSGKEYLTDCRFKITDMAAKHKIFLNTS